MRNKKKIVVITCDSCGTTMYGEPKIVSIDTGKKRRLELCSSCLHRLEIVTNWEKYKDKMEFYIGIEGDFYSNLDRETDEKMGLDFRIGSVHYVKDKNQDNNF